MTDTNESFESEASAGISRRTVTKAMAWAVPVIAVAATVPAAAASGILTLDGRGCKLPGNSQDAYKGYAFGIVACNSTADPIVITINFVKLNGSDLGNILVVNLDTCTALGVNTFTIPAHTCLNNLVILTENAGNSQQGTLEASYTATGVAGTTDVSASVPVVPPVQGSVCTDFTPAEKTCVENIA